MHTEFKQVLDGCLFKHGSNFFFLVEPHGKFRLSVIVELKKDNNLEEGPDLTLFHRSYPV